MRRLNRMFGAISATNEAILRAKTEQELYQRVCDAAVHSGKSAATVVLLAQPDSIWLKPVAGTGAIVEQIMRAPFSIDAGNPYGTGVCGRAFRTQKPAVNNDILNSTQGQPWHQAARETGVTACVAVPLIKADESIGVLMFFVGKSWAEDEEIVALMARIAENVSFALDNFERAGEKARADAQKERLGRMLAALSATNEAIVRATSRTELFELVCEAAAKGGRFNSTSIMLARSDSDYTDMVAVAGPTADNMRRVKVSINADHPEGRGLCGNAFRSRQACIANDLRADPRGSAFHQFIHSDGAMSGAAFPLLVSGQAVGVMFFISSEKDTFTPEFAELLQRLTDNVSFAIGTFDRADEKARTESQKERLTRMFAALSATNEAIMRAKSRDELFDMVCEAAANGGRFTSTTIALANSGSDLLRIVAAAGPAAETTRHVRLSVDEARPEGRGLSGTAFRTRRPCITNDYVTDQRVAAFQAVVGSYGAQSGAAFPLLVRGEPVGVMIYMSLDKDTFTPEFSELLQRLADNVSFALENFDHADDKARTEVQKERLTRMLAALSATNEAIIRATSRAELFELVCEAAAQRRQVYLDLYRADEAGQRFSRRRGCRRSDRLQRPRGSDIDQRGAPGGTRALRSRRYVRSRPASSTITSPIRAPRRFTVRARTDGTNSGASFPLLVQGQVVGVMSFMSLEKDTFTPEFAELLQRLVDNVSFALENFDRVDEKTKADERIEYLASHDSLTQPAEPGNVQRHAAPRDRCRRALPAAVRPAVHRSRQVQGDQRLAGTRRRRHAAGGDRRQAAPCAAFERCRGAARRRRVRGHSGGDRRASRGRAHCRRASLGTEPAAAAQRSRMPHHRLDRDRDVPVRRHRHADADQERRHGDVSRQGGRQERLPLLHQGDQDAVDRAPDAGERPAPRAGARPVLAALSAQDRHGDRTDHRRRGAAALESSRTRHRIAGAVHSAGRGNRADRSDRPLGAQGSLRAEHGLAAPRPAAGDDGGQPVAAAVRRSASVAGCRRGAGWQAACRRCCCSSKSPKAW